MGVYIKGMEMPTRCAVCWLMDGEDSWCCACRGKHLASEFRYGIKDRPDWCPLIEVPPHGRLIDEEALAIVMAEGLCPTEQNTGFEHPFDILRAICAAPTVIQAEEEDNNG